MARINGSGFKMKQSPAKGKLQDFFSSIGSQLRSNKRDLGAEQKSKYKGTKQTTNKAGEDIGSGDTTYDRVMDDSQESRAKRVAKGNTKTFKQAHAADKARQAAAAKTKASTKKPVVVKETKAKKPVVKEEPKGRYTTFTQKGDKYKYRYDAADDDKPNAAYDYEFQRPGSDTWEKPKNKTGYDAIDKLTYKVDTNYYYTPMDKKSPTKNYKKGYYKKNKTKK